MISLATDTDYVQGRLATYLKDLLSLGVTGLRMDAAKHIAAADIANIFSRVGPIPYVTQEVSALQMWMWAPSHSYKVIYGDNEAVQPSEYVGNGNVQELVFQTRSPYPRSLTIGTGSATRRLCKVTFWVVVSYGSET